MLINQTILMYVSKQENLWLHFSHSKLWTIARRTWCLQTLECTPGRRNYLISYGQVFTYRLSFASLFSVLHCVQWSNLSTFSGNIQDLRVWWCNQQLIDSRTRTKPKCVWILLHISSYFQSGLYNARIPSHKVLMVQSFILWPELYTFQKKRHYRSKEIWP